MAGDRPPLGPRLVLRVGTLLAPAGRRQELRRQWAAELAHRWARTARRRGRAPGRDGPTERRAEGRAAGRPVGGGTSEERTGHGRPAPVDRPGAWAARVATAAALTVWALGVVPHALHLRRREARMGGWTVELGQAWRALRRRPGTALVAAGILAAGIGSATAVSSAAEAVLLKPLPFPEGGRLVRLWSRSPRRGAERSSVSWPDFRDWKESGVLAGAALYDRAQVDLAGDGEPERISVAMVGPDFFDVLGASPLEGRLLGGEDERTGADVAVLSEALWRRRWGGDPSVVGRTVRLNGRLFTVVGVLPGEQSWPVSADGWVPLGWGGSPPRSADRDNHAFQAVGRLAPGVDVETARRRLSEVSRRARADLGENDEERGWEASVVPLHLSLYSAGTDALVGLMGIVVLGVLLIVCMNVAGLLLVQARRRARELSLRSALGADRGRLVRQVLLESAIVAATGGLAGTALGVLTLRAALAAAPPELARLGDVGLSPRVLAVALAASLVSALVAGLGPALHASRPAVADALRDTGTRTSGGRRRRRGQRALVVAEVAVSVVLLLGSGLMLRSFQARLAEDPGFRPQGMLSFSLVLPGGRYGSPEAVRSFYDRVRERLAGLPGVREVAMTSTMPLNGGGLELVRAFLPEGAAEPPAGPEYVAQWVEIDPDYFATLGLAPLRGRGFTPDDDRSAEPVMMVTPGLARALAPEGDVLGMRVRSWRDENVYRRVVGVAPEHEISDIGSGDLPVVFVPVAQAVRRARVILVRVEGDPAPLVPGVRRAMAELDPDLAVARLSTLEDVRRRDVAPLRYLAALFSGFGLAALLLAMAGVYGLVAFSVASRTREIGIRMAVGATRGRVRRMVLREGGGVVALGLLLGLGGGVFFARALSGTVEGVGWADAPTWAAVAVLLAAAALAATAVPSVRASKVDPVRSLTVE